MSEIQGQVKEDWHSSWWYKPWIRLLVGFATISFVISFSVYESGLESFFFIGLSLIFVVPLEKLIPRHPIGTFRPELLTDLFHHFVSGFLGVVPLIFLYPLLREFQWATLTSLIQSQPVWLQIAGALLLSEFLIYWGH